MCMPERLNIETSGEYEKTPDPRGICKDVKGKELRERQFVRM